MPGAIQHLVDPSSVHVGNVLAERFERLERISDWLAHHERIVGNAGYRPAADRRAQRHLHYDRGGGGFSTNLQTEKEGKGFATGPGS